jgi:tRNA(fMet)-specific endonuclease VapC
MNWLVIDTDVVSFHFKKDSRAQAYVTDWPGKMLAISFMTFAELKLWALVRKWGKTRIDQLDLFVKRQFVVYPADEQLCQLWASVIAEARSHGRKLDTADAWIAATALAIGAPLVTHNAKDFAGISGLTLHSQSHR